MSIYNLHYICVHMCTCVYILRVNKETFLHCCCYILNVNICARVCVCVCGLQLRRECSLGELMDQETCMVKQIRSLDSDMQTLVYENYNKFISATGEKNIYI